MPSVTPEQQRLFGQAYAIKTGKLKPEDLNPQYRDQITKLADSMTTKQLKDYAETKHSEMEEEEYEQMSESRTQIKRKYGDYTPIKVNEKAPIRNRVIEFVGKRFVTEEEMKNFLTQLSEDKGNQIDQRLWFKRNMKFFESFENRGQKVWTLSKYGKRVLEMIKGISRKQLNESSMKNLPTFNQYVNESLEEE